MWRLINHRNIPPGSYPYEQTDGIRHTFEPLSDIDEQARLVAAFRKGNNLSRPGFAEAWEDIAFYTCQRLGNMPRYCFDTDRSFAAVASQSVRRILSPCGGCGAPV